MKISDIQDALRFVDKNAGLFCELPSERIKSRIYSVGQVSYQIPGFTLGEREPYIRELTVDDVLSSILTFDDDFADNDFLFTYNYDVDERNYEIRYYEITDISLSEGNIVFLSSKPELIKLRQKLQVLDESDYCE